MRAGFTGEQLQLQREARRFLERRAPVAEARRVMETARGYDPELWRAIGELGWTALGVPEAFGGAGSGLVELACVLEEMGRVLLCAPFFSTVCLGAGALALGGSDEQRGEILPALAEGRATATLAAAEAEGDWNSVAATARPAGGDLVLDGEKNFVIDGHTADWLLVTARDAAGVGIYLVRGDAPGVSRAALPALDPTRKLAAVRLDGVRVPASARLPGDGAALVERVLDRARVALAAEQLGGAARCLELSVDYAKTRVQFGRPIGSFQAIKHKCADLLVLVESARSACYAAAATVESELPIAAAVARSYCSDAFFRSAAETIQIHGGIGFTWEHDAHLFFRRARASASLLGEAAAGRERIARHLGL